jgi:aspartate carbamoyltransferase catalytic subunit
MKHFLSTSDLSTEDANILLDAATSFKKTQNIPPLLAGKTVVNLFFENSTRTRISFEIATRKMGGSVLNFASATSSVNKGETLVDTAKNIEAMGPDCMVVRHASAGAPLYLAKRVSIPVVNAGDGFHEHPTQALLDAFTIRERLGSLSGKRIVILGDIAHSRVARSNIHLLKKLGASIAVCGPPTLLPPHPEALGVDFALRPEDLLKEADVVMTLRIQFERQNKMQIPSVAEYTKFWGITRERAALLKDSAIILHPGPINRGVELDAEVADSSRSLILDQVGNGVMVRMAVLAKIVNPNGFQKWFDGREK